LFSRPPSSVLAKMANLDGSRSHGARWDVLAGALLRDDPARFSRIYRVLLQAARAEGIGAGSLHDCLGLEHGGELALLGQEELDISVLDADLRDKITATPPTVCCRSLIPNGSCWRRPGSGSMSSPGMCYATAAAGASSAA